jgi:hypothetical protein
MYSINRTLNLQQIVKMSPLAILRATLPIQTGNAPARSEPAVDARVQLGNRTA